VRGRRLSRFAAYVLLSVPLSAASGALAAGAPTSVGLIGCEPVVSGNNVNDYRERDSVPQVRRNIDDFTHYHFEPLIARLEAGEHSRRVMADLDFVLRHSPNHSPGLEALIRYKLAGGKAYEFLSTECYFERARQFVPDDVSVLLYEGYYFWKKGDQQRAISAYLDGLSVDPDSADAHYNLGLLYFEKSEYQKALEHAHAAYGAGYPLPGLRKKLEKAGYWHEGAASEAK
jgi:tetratricopeptide (TPR) repeat protein